MTECAVCYSRIVEENASYALLGFVSCPRCGPWQPLGQFLLPVSMILAGGRGPMHRGARLSHIIRTSTREGEVYGFNPSRVDALHLDEALPSPLVQIDTLILWLGQHQRNYVEPLELPVPELSARMGAPLTHNPPSATPLVWLLSQSDAARYVEQTTRHDGQLFAKLTLAGWTRFETLSAAVASSQQAFMALQFGDPELSHVVDNCFRPAVNRAGFSLRLLNENQPAGLIDDQLRVAIRQARFTISDLTHGNSGAYWEAGFAEGLGRPVVYTCRKKEWDAQKTHFDTNHLLTIIWSSDNLDAVGAQLTATIRATLPTEARMGD